MLKIRGHTWLSASIPLMAALLVVQLSLPLAIGQNADGESSSIPLLDYEVVGVFPHSSQSFTQGLVYEDGILYEGTGLYGRSSLLRIDLQTGRILQQIHLESDLFGEGVALWKDRIIQLTWTSGLGLVYGKDNFTRIGSFSYETEGWGLTADNKSLIMSDGTDTLHILDPESYANVGQISVTADGRPLQLLNELEYINGMIYANIWKTDKIAVISRQSGEVKGIIDLQGLLQQEDVSETNVDVLNGIAYNAINDTLIVTGKLWPELFEIKVAQNGDIMI